VPLFKKRMILPESEELVRGDLKTWENRVEGKYIDTIWSAQNSVTRRAMVADKEILQVKSGLNLRGKMRILLTFVLDCSMSMSDEMYTALYKGMNRFAKIMTRTESMSNTDISVISIERSQIRMRQDFAACSAGVEIPDTQEQGKGLSPIVCAVYLAHKRGLRRKENYAMGGINCYRPITIVFSDFKNNDARYNGISDSSVQEMLQEINDTESTDVLKICTESGNPLFSQLQGTELQFMTENFSDGHRIAEWFYDLYMVLCEMLHIQQDAPVSPDTFSLEEE